MNPILTELDICIKNIADRYITALYSYELYTHLHQSLDSEIYPNKIAESNCNIRNELPWILGKNTEIIFFNLSIFALYSVYEEKNDIDNIVKLLDLIEKNIAIVNKEIDLENCFHKNQFGDKHKRLTNRLIRGLRNKILVNGVNPGVYLKDYRHQLGHNFTNKKRRTINLHTKKIEKILHSTGYVINKISSMFPQFYETTNYGDYGENISEDFRRLFFFLNRQKQVGELITFGNFSDESILLELNKIYRPQIIKN